MLPEMVEYDRVVNDASAEYRRKRSELDPEEYPRYSDARYHALDKLDIERNRAIYEAWTKLRESENELVRWIAKNCETNRSAACIIMRELPCSLDRMNELADEHDWCTDYDRLVDRAMRDGVLHDSTAGSPAAQKLIEWTRSNCDLRMRDVHIMRTLILAVSQKAVEASKTVATSNNE